MRRLKYHETARAAATAATIATLIAHRPQDHQGPARCMQITIALEHLAICGGFVLLILTGPGRYSFDAMWR